MAELATIARPYAEALFRVAKSTNLTAWAEVVGEMAQVAAHPDVMAMVQNPKIPATTAAGIFLSALKSPLTEQATNFVNTLASYHRLLVLPEIAAQFHVLKNAHDGAADALISSAFALTEAQVSQLCADLEAKFGRKLQANVSIDPSLIGGVRIEVGDEVLDTSVRAKLQQMQLALTA